MQPCNSPSSVPSSPPPPPPPRLHPQVEALSDLRNVFGMGRKEAEEAAAEVTSKAYKRLLSNAVTSGALDKAASKAEFLQDLCDNLRFDPDLATAMHAGEAWGRRRETLQCRLPVRWTTKR